MRFCSFLCSSNLCILCYNSLNPATLLPLPNKGETYNCVELVPQSLTPRLDLQETPLTNPELILYVDGSYAKNSAGKYQNLMLLLPQMND